jgi:hypothetical protein
MKNKKKIIKSYTVWDYELEIQELNRESMNGWQLVHGGIFYRTYERDDSVVYRYQLDYNRSDSPSYYEMFQEQGWEYINSTCNGWNYFRKPYDETASESEYLIYTDLESKKNMHKRFLRIMGFVFLAVIFANMNRLFAFIETPKFVTSGILFFYIIYLYIFAKAVIGLARVEKGIMPKKRSRIGFYLFLITISLILTFCVNERYYQVNVNNQVVETDVEKEHVFFYEVAIPDVYYFQVVAEEGETISLEIIDEERNVVYQKQTVDEQKKNIKIFLRSGQYQCIIRSLGNSEYSLHIK